MNLFCSAVLLTVLSFVFNCDLSIASAVSHRCIHGEAGFQSRLEANLCQESQVYYGSAIETDSASDLKNNKPREKRENSVPVHSQHDNATWDPIRIFVDKSHLTNRSKVCTAVGDVRPDFLGSNIFCLAEDIITMEKLWVIERRAIPLALRWIERIFNVVRVKDRIVVPPDACGVDMTIPPAHTNPGVANADFVLYVHAAGWKRRGSSNSNRGLNPIAWAMHCVVDQNGRPIAAHINFVPSSITWHASGWSLDKYVRVIVHEFFHTLGFTPKLIRPMMNTSRRRGKFVTLVVAPAVVAAARELSDCESLDGVELEDEGGEGTAGTHWERRQWMDELMTGIPSRAAVSSISLAFFDSLGFYKVNMGHKESMAWGHNVGCDFVDEPCTADSVRMGIEWCDEAVDKILCTYDHTAAGFCNWGAVQDLPAYFQYFASDPTRGGLTPLMDYCPVVRAYDDLHCQDSASSTPNDAIFGNYFGEHSRCIDTSHMVSYGYVTDDTSPRCLRVRCVRGTRVEVLVGNRWLSCPDDGSAGDIAILPLTGYKGTIHCAPASRICTPALYTPSDEQAPLREYVFDVIFLLRAANASTNAGLASAAAFFPGDFFARFASDLLRLYTGAGAARLFPEMATAAASSRGGVLVYAQLGISARGGPAALRPHFAAGSAMTRVGETVRIDAANVFPDSKVLDSVTVLGHLEGVADVTVHFAGESLAGLKELEPNAIELLSNAAKQDLARVLFVTDNLVRVRKVEMLETGMLSIEATVSLPPPPDTDNVDNATAIMEMWRDKMSTLLHVKTAFPVLTSTSFELSHGVPLFVETDMDSVGLVVEFLEVQKPLPPNAEVSWCFVQFAYCSVVQIVILVICVLGVVLLFFICFRMCVSGKGSKEPSKFQELDVPLQPVRAYGSTISKRNVFP